MEPWMAALRRGDAERAWDLFLERYRRLVFATIRHYVQDYDDVMDVFAHVCEALHTNRLSRLQSYEPARAGSARFSTWLVAVVRNLVMDWFRQRDGRKRLSSIIEQLPARQREIFEEVARQGRSHLEAFEQLRSRGASLSYREFRQELAALYRTLGTGRGGYLRRELIGAADWEPEPSPDADAAIEAERAERLQSALSTLDATTRLALRLYVIEGLPATDVARIAGWPTAKTVYNKVYRGLLSLRQALARQGIQRGDL